MRPLPSTDRSGLSTGRSGPVGLAKSPAGQFKKNNVLAL